MKIFGEMVACVLLGLFIAFALLGWVYRCGETYVDAQGVRHEVECKSLFNNGEESK